MAGSHECRGNTLLPKKLAANRLKFKDIGDGIRYGEGIIKWGPWVGHQGEALGYETWALHNTETGVAYVARPTPVAEPSPWRRLD